ncbi:MAG: NAD(P)/FAD-dependent oxidoreductase, partial [Candidatus Dormibacteraeota bacterium]|nr:NAD(P)/FAD-dependent oxidoreductase [Candidatus Dormibacteraeota bacterium]
MRLLAREEPESSALVADVFRREGIELHTGVSADRVREEGGQIEVTLSDGAVVAAERLLVAIGRRTNLASLQLQTAGLDPHAGLIAVDDRLRTAVPGIWAIGDITGHGAFTHISLYQADIACNDILGVDAPGADYRAVPRVTFTDPEVGSVGLTEAQARDKGLTVRTGIADISKTARGWIHKAGNDGLIKLVEDADRGVLVGASSVGPCGGEVLSMLMVAVHAEVPVSKLCTMITAYPTWHRGLEDALRDLKAMTSPQSARDCPP